MDIIENTIITSDIVKIDSVYENAEEAIKHTAGLLKDEGLVKDSFLGAILEREKVFPTGLQFENYGVVIPHTDAEHVNKQAIAINILKEPVTFTMMATDDEKVEVKIIIMLAIKEINNQVLFLQSLMNLFQNEKVVNKILNSKNENEIIEIFKKNINEVE